MENNSLIEDFKNLLDNTSELEEVVESLTNILDKADDTCITMLKELRQDDRYKSIINEAMDIIIEKSNQYLSSNSSNQD